MSGDDVARWFKQSVTYDGEAYTLDIEQAEAVACDTLNTIVVARAGSGKTRTIVAKILYLVAKCEVSPDEIMVFVFNANAAKEINERLSKMRVDGKLVIEKAKVATTFHAFARKVVYDICGGRNACGQILAGEKEKYVLELLRRMMREEKWQKKIAKFVKGSGEAAEKDLAKEPEEMAVSRGMVDDEELERFAKMMVQFINRAQQKYLGGEVTVREVGLKYLETQEVGGRERVFVELGLECFKRYHWYLLDAKRGLPGFSEYGTDFNLIVSWSNKLIALKRGAVREWLEDKKWILIDEYQDFSQLFLAAVEAIRGVAPDAKLFVVGDDLQAINRFAGSDVEYFREFEQYFPYGVRRLLITTNYRCDREVVGVARKFMKKAMGERGRFRAFSRRGGKVVLVDPRETDCEFAVMDYDKRVSGRDEIYRMMAKKMVGRTPKFSTVRYIKTLVEVIRKNKKAEGILILHRNNVTEMEGITLLKLSHGLRLILADLEIMKAEEYDQKVRVMTIHKSKGLEAEVVIILEADEGVIPRSHPDTRLFGVFGETNEVALDDQKRLFYVAMTRAKRRLYIIHDRSLGAGFVKFLGRGVERFGG